MYFIHKKRAFYFYAIGIHHYFKQVMHIIFHPRYVFQKEKSYCQIEWNFSRGIYRNSQSSTSHCCLKYLRLHEKWEKMWLNCVLCKMICFESEHTCWHQHLTSFHAIYSRLEQRLLCILRKIWYVLLIYYDKNFPFVGRMRMISLIGFLTIVICCWSSIYL